MQEVSPSEAVSWALSANGTSGLPQGRCDHSTAVAYTPGHSWANSHSGSTSAIDHWNHIVSSDPQAVHMGDMNAPAGALVFWQGGQYGHAALSLGQDSTGQTQIASTDISGTGTYTTVPISRIARDWGNLKYLGWTNPDFPDNGGTKGPNLAVAGASGPSGVSTGGTSTSGFPSPSAGSSNGLVGANGFTTTVPGGADSTIIRILKIGGGVGLIIVGLVLLLRKPIAQAADLGAGVALGTTPTGNVAKTFIKGKAYQTQQGNINARQERGQLFRSSERQARQDYGTQRSETLFNQRAESTKANQEFKTNFNAENWKRKAESTKANQEFKTKFNAENWKRKTDYQAQGHANSTSRSNFVGKRNAAAEATRQANRTASENLRQANRVFNINKRQRAKAEDQVVSKLIKNMSVDEILKMKPQPKKHGNKAKPTDFGLKA